MALCLAGEALGDLGINLQRLMEPLPDEDVAEGDQSKPQSWEQGTLLAVQRLGEDEDLSETARGFWRGLVEGVLEVSLPSGAEMAAAILGAMRPIQITPTTGIQG